jgi:hypothetical protein
LKGTAQPQFQRVTGQHGPQIPFQKYINVRNSVDYPPLQIGLTMEFANQHIFDLCSIEAPLRAGYIGKRKTRIRPDSIVRMVRQTEAQILRVLPVRPSASDNTIRSSVDPDSRIAFTSDSLLYTGTGSYFGACTLLLPALVP